MQQLMSVFCKTEMQIGKVWCVQMKKWTKALVTEQYIVSCAVIQSATLIGDYKSANKEKDKLLSAFKWLEKNIHEASGVLGELLHNSSPVVQTKAAAHCLCLQINQDEALHVLETVSKRSDIWGFNAEKVLEVYQKNGFLKA